MTTVRRELWRVAGLALMLLAATAGAQEPPAGTQEPPASASEQPAAAQEPPATALEQPAAAQEEPSSVAEQPGTAREERTGIGSALNRVEGAVVEAVEEELAQTRGPNDVASPEHVAPTFGERITGSVPRLAAAGVRYVTDIANAFRATMRRLQGFSRLDVERLGEIGREIAPVFAASVGVAYLARIAAMPLYRRIGRVADRRHLFKTTFVALLATAIDLLTVALGFVAGYAVGGEIFVEGTDDASFWFLYLAAYMVVGIIVVAIRAVFSPATELLRPLPMDDASARYWHRWLGFVVALVGFGEILIRPVIAETVSPITARATLVMIYFVTAAILIYLIVRNRRAIPAYFERRAAETEGDVSFAVLAWVTRFWPLVAIPYVLVMLHQAVTSGERAMPMIYNAVDLAVALAAGAFVIALIDRLERRGVSLPEAVTRAVPSVEPQINAFLPGFLRLLRLIVLVLWVGYALQVLGAWDIAGWIETRAGVDALGIVANLIFIVIGAFIAWLLVSSWIDSRLSPRLGHYPTARERTLLALFRNAALVAILLVALTYVLSSFGVSIAPLLASAGVVGLAIGFGAQKLVQDIINGLFIQFENAINVGDVVDVGGKVGTVEKLTIRSVSVRDLQGVYHMVPFSSVDLVSNFMKGFSYHVADIGIAYRENVDEAKALMLAAFDDLRADPELGPKIFEDLEWFGVEALGDSSVVLRARLKTLPGEQWGIGRAYNEAIKKRFDAAGVEIPFPHMTLWFGERKDGTAPPARLARAVPQKTASAPAFEMPASDLDRGRLRRDAPTDAEGDGGPSGDR